MIWSIQEHGCLIFQPVLASHPITRQLKRSHVEDCCYLCCFLIIIHRLLRQHVRLRTEQLTNKNSSSKKGIAWRCNGWSCYSWRVRFDRNSDTYSLILSLSQNTYTYIHANKHIHTYAHIYSHTHAHLVTAEELRVFRWICEYIRRLVGLGTCGAKQSKRRSRKHVTQDNSYRYVDGLSQNRTNNTAVGSRLIDHIKTTDWWWDLLRLNR